MSFVVLSCYGLFSYCLSILLYKQMNFFSLQLRENSNQIKEMKNQMCQNSRSFRSIHELTMSSRIQALSVALSCDARWYHVVRPVQFQVPYRTMYHTERSGIMFLSMSPETQQTSPPWLKVGHLHQSLLRGMELPWLRLRDTWRDVA